MRQAPGNLNKILLEFDELRARLDEAESTIEAIRTGEVDALIVRGQDGDQVFTLKGVDEPYRVFVEEMGEGAVTLDAHATVLYCNRAFAEMVGEHLERVIGNELSHFLADQGAACETISHLTKAGSIETMLACGCRTVPVLCTTTPIKIDGPSAFAVTVTNLSAQKEHEAALRRATVELEAFCYSVSHDMRAPLRAMVSNAKMVIEDYGKLLPSAAVDELRTLAGSANYLARLMDDLLAYSRLARQHISGQRVDLSEMAKGIASKLSHNGGRDVEWTIESGLEANGDPRFLEMALHNLFANAAKFSAKRDNAKVVFGRSAETGAFFVEDNGIGFDMRYVHKLFIPFERLHRQTDYDGTGIGLANVKRIIDLHGGKVWADGEEGRRATFFFTLP